MVFALTFVVAFIAFWQLVVRAPAVSYGTPGQTFFESAQVVEGEKFKLCFAGITWYRLCHGTLATHLTPTFGTRIDFPSYTINTPGKKGPVDPKCREMTAPLLNGRTGPFTFGGHASFTCTLNGAPDVILPALKLDIRKKS
jgi:hypothetical protein